MPNTETQSLSATLGVVLSGGGTLSAYAVGALRALAEVHGVASPQVLVATSGGAAAGMFYLVGRFADMYAWADLFDDPRFISWRRIGAPIMDINFLVDGILAIQAPNLPNEVGAIATKFFIPATALPEGKPHWFSHADTSSLFDVLRATKTVPGICGDGVKINGSHFVDGSFSVSIEECIAKAFAEGAEKVVLIDNASYGPVSLLTQTLMRWQVRRASREVQAVVERYIDGSKRTRPPEAQSRLLVCRRSRLASRHPLNRAAHRSHKTIAQGYEDMASLNLA
jgi:predicted patatin/cPLA2 family phospholipase